MPTPSSSGRIRSLLFSLGVQSPPWSRSVGLPGRAENAHPPRLGWCKVLAGRVWEAPGKASVTRTPASHSMCPSLLGKVLVSIPACPKAQAAQDLHPPTPQGDILTSA